MPHKLPILVREFFQTSAKRVAAGFQQTRALDCVLRQKIDRHIAQLRTDATLLAPEPVHLVVSDHAHPLHEVRTKLKRLVFAPENDADDNVVLGVIRQDGNIFAIVDADALIAACQTAALLETA